MEKCYILIKNGRIWDGRKFLTDGQDVAVSDGKIAAIGNLADYSARYVLDAKGAIIAPGLIDTHMHIKGCSYKATGAPAEAVTFPFGVTTAVECTAASVADAGGDFGNFLDNLQLKTFVFANVEFTEIEGDIPSAVKTLERYPGRGLGLKVLLDTKVSDYRILDGTPLEKVCAYAHERGWKVMVHSSNPPIPMSEVMDILQPGDICTHIFHGGINTVADEAFLSLKKAEEKGIFMDVGLAAGQWIDFSIARAAMEKGFYPHSIGTDLVSYNAFLQGGVSGLTTAMTVMRELGMPEEKLLEAVTGSAAQTIGQEHALGRLEIGRTADIAVIGWGNVPMDMTDKSGNHLTCEQGYQCRLTMANGNVVYRQGI